MMEKRKKYLRDIQIHYYKFSRHAQILALANIKFREFWLNLLLVSNFKKKETTLQSHKSDHISLK